MPPFDTTTRAREIQLQIFRKQTASERFQAAIEMSDFVHELAAAGLRSRLSGSDAEDFSRAFVEMLYGVIPRRER